PGGRQAPRTARVIVLRWMAQAGVRETPAAWVESVTQVLTGANEELTREAVATARAFRLPKQRPEKLIAALLRIAQDTKALAGVRLAALAAVPGGPGKIEPPLFDFLRSQLHPELPVGSRTTAADVLSRAR